MKKQISLAMLVFLIGACSQPEDQNAALLNLYQQRDSLRTLFSSVSDNLKNVEEEILLKDTTVLSRNVLVTAALLKPEKFEHFVEVHGVVESEKNITLNSEINSIIKSIKVSEGEKVRKGQVLVLLDRSVIQKSIDEIETAFDLANTVFQRQEKLWKQNIGSEIQYLEAKNRKVSIEQKLETLKAQREMAVVKAPFSGVVDEIFTREGEMANPMAPLIRLVNLDEMYITAEIPENYLKTIKTGNMAIVRFPSLDIEINSKISRIGQYINPSNRTFKVQVKLDKSAEMLRPNLLAVMMLKTYEKDSAVVVPSSAIQQDASGKEYVFIVSRNGAASFSKKSTVKTERTYNNKTLISEGLTGNEEIIIEGARTVKENDKIDVGIEL